MNLYSNALYQQDMERTFQAISGIDRLRHTKILITGARGMIGSFLTEFLMYCNDKKGFQCEIYGAGRDVEQLTQRFVANAESPYLHLIAYHMEEDVASWDFDVDYIIHCAGNAYPNTFMSHPSETVLNNVMGTYRLLRYAYGIHAKRLLYLSSGEVYGQWDGKADAFPETYRGYVDSMNPRSCYPLSKLAAEAMCASFYSQYGQEAAVARLCHVYGPTETKEDMRITSLCFRAALENKPIVLKSLGSQIRSYCYVADCISGMLTILLDGTAGEVYNVASREGRVSIRELAKKVAILAGIELVYDYPEDGEIKSFNSMERAVLDPLRLEKMGWNSAFSLADGLSHTIRLMEEQSIAGRSKREREKDE